MNDYTDPVELNPKHWTSLNAHCQCRECAGKGKHPDPVPDNSLMTDMMRRYPTVADLAQENFRRGSVIQELQAEIIRLNYRIELLETANKEVSRLNDKQREVINDQQAEISRKKNRIEALDKYSEELRNAVMSQPAKDSDLESPAGSGLAR